MCQQVLRMQLPGHGVWREGGREGVGREGEKARKYNKKGSRVTFLGNLVSLLLARLWLYRELYCRTPVAKERKGKRETKR